ncbi:hypothetical protein Tco_1475340 [Tanacetum coccineum]
MESIARSTHEGYEDAIVVPVINAYFELKHGFSLHAFNNTSNSSDMYNEDPHAHIRFFKQDQFYVKFTERPGVVQLTAYQAHAHLSSSSSKSRVSRKISIAIVKANDAVMRKHAKSIDPNLTDMFQVFHRSGVASPRGPRFILLLSFPKVMDVIPMSQRTRCRITTNNGSTKDVPPPVVPVVYHELISEPVNALVSASRPNQKASIPFPSRRNEERRREKLTTHF